MEILASKAGKKFNRQWIFRSLDFHVPAAEKFAILGPNGSGKSTLLRCIAGVSSLSEGQLNYNRSAAGIPAEKLFEHCTLSSPVQELIEELTLEELLQFHFRFRKMIYVKEIEEIAGQAQLGRSLHKQVKDFSSGMKQRLKLALCFFTEASLLLLDEPCTNLDAQGVSLYHYWMENYTAQRTVVIASNIKHEYEMCTHELVLA